MPRIGSALVEACDVRGVVGKTAITALTTGLIGLPLRRVLIRAGLFDVPNHRSSHSSPTPRSGGIAPVAAATAISFASRSTPSHRASAVILGLTALGFVDDVTGHLSPKLRIAAQAASGVVLANGSRRPLAAVGTAGIVNVVNFMDGINGISGGTAAVWGVNAIALGSEDRQLTELGVLALGGALGFLPHNAPTARLFLGDAGSYAMGGLLAAGVLSQRCFTDQWRVASPLLLYGLDAAQALAHRVRTKQRIGVAHRDHVYQRLVDAGFSHVSVATFHAGLAAIVAVSHRLPTGWTAGATIAAAVTYLVSPYAARRYHAGGPQE